MATESDIPINETPETLALIHERERREADNGTVDVRAFDEGVVETLGAVVDPTFQNYFLKVNCLAPPSGLPGFPVTFAFPEDVFEKYRAPVIVVKRDDMYPAMQRWHPNTKSYRIPAPGALTTTVQTPDGPKTGFNRVIERYQAQPFDFMYTISIITKDQGAGGQRNVANELLLAILETYQPYCQVFVRDSVGDIRTYEAFMEGVGMLDAAIAVGNRTIGYSVTLRIEAELDTQPTYIRPTVTSLPIQRLTKIKLTGG